MDDDGKNPAWISGGGRRRAGGIACRRGPKPQYPKDGDPKDGCTDGDRDDMDAASVLDHMDL